MKKFVVPAVITGFLISLEYGITRPASNAIFITQFSPDYFPYAWLAMVPLNFLVISFYNRLVTLWGCVKTFLVSTSIVSTINILTAIFALDIPLLAFLQFICKDIYILLMFKQLWSLVHHSMDTAKAKYLYGLLFGVGSFGSTLGGLFPSFFAVNIGSNKLFYFTLPIYLAISYSYYLTYSRSGGVAFTSEEKGSFSLIKKSRLLPYILLLVIAMQISIAFIDYQFHVLLQKNIPTLDLRTQYCGRAFTFINFLAMTCQVFGSYLFIHFLGLKNIHRLIPFVLIANVLLFLLFPTFGVISYAFIMIKTIDFSFFGVAKEMLYTPLSTEEKFQGKAIIDIFASRTAKAFASFLLLFCQFLLHDHTITLVSYLAIGIYALWIAVAFKMFTPAPSGEARVKF